MRSLTPALALVFFFLGSQAANADETASHQGQIRDRLAKVSVEKADVTSGPAEAYTRRGRVYRGDVLTVRGKPGSSWVEIMSGDVRGWIRLSKLTIIPYGQIRKDKGGQVDAGRDRRETNYSYDAQGRRRHTGGGLMGSGEGTQTEDQRPETSEEERSVYIDVGVGIGQVDRKFYSNSSMLSVLYGSAVAPVGLSTYLDAQWRPSRWFSVTGSLQDVRLGSSRVTAPPLNEGAPIEIAVDSQTSLAALHIHYSTPQLTVGGFTGVHLFRTGFQETKPVPLFLDTVVWSGVFGAKARYQLGAIEFDVQAGLLVPLSVHQEPKSSGQDTASGHHISAHVRWWALNNWALNLHLNVDKIYVEYQGDNDHIDTVTEGGPYTYTQARESTQVWTFGLGVSRAL